MNRLLSLFGFIIVVLSSGINGTTVRSGCKVIEEPATDSTWNPQPTQSGGPEETDNTWNPPPPPPPPWSEPEEFTTVTLPPPPAETAAPDVSLGSGK